MKLTRITCNAVNDARFLRTIFFTGTSIARYAFQTNVDGILTHMDNIKVRVETRTSSMEDFLESQRSRSTIAIGMTLQGLLDAYSTNEL